MKQTQQTPQNDTPPQAPEPRQQSPFVYSTAEILSRGVSLAEVLHVVRQLRPLVQRVS